MSDTCDTSVLVPALLGWHEAHRIARTSVKNVTAVPSHVLLETYSVLTRLPAPHRLSPADVGALLGALDWMPVALPPDEERALVRSLAQHTIRGGAAYDALVGITAKHHGLRLLTRDRRARGTYEALAVPFFQP